LSLTALFFVISGIQYWITNYFVQVLEVDEKSANIYFALTCITSPILGALVSGKISLSFGNCDSPKAINTCIFYGIIAVCASLPFPFIDDYRICIILIWIILFCGALILPILTGIMLSTVQPDLRP
jgi:sugar phosphate permease